MSLLLVLTLGPFKEVDGQILCPRWWVEEMVQKDDSLQFINDSLIPWYEDQITLLDSIVSEQEVIISDQEQQLEYLEEENKIEKSIGDIKLRKGFFIGGAAGLLLGVILGVWISS